MTVLPVVARELRVASRRSWTYWSRFVAGGVAISVSAWMMLLEGRLAFGHTGEPLFFLVSSVGFGFGLLAGLLYSADSVSSEKRDGTLGLLFLTDLRGFDVALGKLAATSLGAFYGLVAVLPLLALTLLMGGVALADYGRMVLVLVTTLFCSLAVGLLASVLTTDLRRSVLVTFLLLLAMISAGPLVYETLSWSTNSNAWPSPRIANCLSAATPFSAFVRTLGSNYNGDPTAFWQGLAYTGAVGLFALGYASWRLPRVWQTGALDERGSGISGRLDRLRFPTLARRTAFRRRWLDENPVTWLSARFWVRSWLVWVFLLGTLFVVRFLGPRTNSWWEPETGIMIGLFFHLALKFWVANEAPRQFLEDRRSGAMELLLSTSLTVDDLIEGRWRALQRQFLGPLIFVWVTDVGWLMWLVSSNGGMTDQAELVWAGMVCMVMLGLDLWALVWDGLWVGLTTRGRATTSSMIARILALPWVIWFAGLTVVNVSGSNIGSGEWSWVALLGSWFAIGAAVDWFWALRARAALRASFREVAVSRPSARRWFRRSTRVTASTV